MTVSSMSLGAGDALKGVKKLQELLVLHEEILERVGLVRLR